MRSLTVITLLSLSTAALADNRPLSGDAKNGDKLLGVAGFDAMAKTTLELINR